MSHRPSNSIAAPYPSSATQPAPHPQWLPSRSNMRPNSMPPNATRFKPALTELKLDCLRASLSATRIVARDTKECLYSITVDQNACSPVTTGLHRGSVFDEKTSRRVGSSPFATFKGKSIYMNEKNQPANALKVKKRDFLYSSGIFGQVNRFMVQNIEYKLHKPSGSSDVHLIVSSDSTKTPLCRFGSDDENGERSSTIDILSRAISSDQAPKPYALVHNERPTMLLDMVLIAEKIYRANSRRKSTEKSPDEQDDYSSDLEGEA